MTRGDDKHPVFAVVTSVRPLGEPENASVEHLPADLRTFLSSKALNSELGHPASGTVPLEHGPGRKCILLLGKIPGTMRKRAMESKAACHGF